MTALEFLLAIDLLIEGGVIPRRPKQREEHRKRQRAFAETHPDLWAASRGHSR